MLLTIGDKFLIPLTKIKRIKTRYVRKIWYIDTFGNEVMDTLSFLRIKDNKMTATVHNIHKNYVELKLENMKVITVHHEYLEKLERLL